VSAACAIAFFASIAYLDTQWNPLRWIVAASTGCMGVFALGRIAAVAPSVRAVLVSRSSWLSALLVGSSCADIVSLHFEARGHAWGALPAWQCITLVTMALISIIRRSEPRSNYEPPLRAE
jgi:hypothetical protein